MYIYIHDIQCIIKQILGSKKSVIKIYVRKIFNIFISNIPLLIQVYIK